jgi:hypothetical protein
MTPTPNWFAFVALLLWPAVALCLYLKRPVGQATLWTILGAQMLLPVGTAIKFEGIPQFDKNSIPNLAAFIGCLLVLRRPLRIWNGFGIAGILILMYLVGPFITAELNGDPIFLTDRTLPAETHYDALSAVVAQFIFLLPFFLGHQLLRSSADNEEILRVLVIAGLIYSVPILFEIRMSPQLHAWIYGYHGSSFVIALRGGGYRPSVFMQTGLLLAFFMMTTAVAAAAFWRVQTRIHRLPSAGVTLYLSTILVLCKSLGALVYGAVLAPLVRFTKPRIQLRVALVLVGIALLYPILRAGDVFPTKTIVEIANLVSADRASSLEFRFDNEERLLERGSQRFLFGWGRWGRSRVYDPETGNDLSTTDGRWIITMGQFGFFGFLAEFGLLALSVFRAASALRFTQSVHEQVCLAALALIVAINVVDLLPNATFTPWTWLLAGALLGRAETLRTVALRPEKLKLQLSR